MVPKRSVTLNGQRTSISLEQPFWDALKEIAEESDMSIARLVATVHAKRNGSYNRTLSSDLRLFILAHFRKIADSAVLVR